MVCTADQILLEWSNQWECDGRGKWKVWEEKRNGFGCKSQGM